ncbi:DNA ligase 4 [Rhodocollybia butyracea]|uniref:DNA ligase n=1 Tax=Rhodocollybia butyracea TaxID=206335 RepID=A0A9P5PYD2_9AGAR|nr:DNA ligase 4 [Rhodocollybia butyracea]
MQPTPAPTTPPRSPPPDTSESSYPPPPQNIGPSPGFGVLVGLFERLSNERKQDKRRKHLNRWFEHYRTEVGNDLFPVLRLILPQKDRDRSAYGLKETNLAKVYLKLIGAKNSDDAGRQLLGWKKPTEKNKSSGDFPGVLFDVVYKRSSVLEGSLTIAKLNEILDGLCKAMGNRDAQRDILQEVYDNATAEEQKWIARIILKDMVISVKETTVLSVFHPDAQDLYNTCSDMKKVAWTLYDPNLRLNPDEKSVQLFHAFTPMLCKRPTKTIELTVKEMDGLEFFIEEKLDGERMQLHKRGNEYFYCSRKGTDYTYLYGKHKATGSLTPRLAPAFDGRVDSAILDGEMLVWDEESGRTLPFGTLKTAALDKSKKGPKPCFKIFDMVYLNGQSLLDKSTSFRKRNLRSCLTEIKGVIEFATEHKGKSAADVRAKMEEVMDARGEGLVIKHPKAKYILNGRNSDWIKVKPEYMDGMGETVDVLVVAGNYGTGSRGGGVSTLICAVLDDSRTDGVQRYSTFVRIGTGLSYADYVWIRSKSWKKRDPKKPPEDILTSKKGYDDKGDLYLEPDQRFIIKVKAAEITTSEQYHMGWTMRFPRALCIRDDLDAEQCLTSSELLESLRNVKKRKMEDTVDVSKKKRKVTAKKPQVVGHRGPKMKGVVPVLTDVFDGLNFVVMTYAKSKTEAADRKELVKTIHENGGSCFQVAANHENMYIIYNGPDDFIPHPLANIISKGKYDVLRPNWINDSVALGHQAPLKKKYFFRRAVKDEHQDSDPEDDQDVDMTEAASSTAVGHVNRSQTVETQVKDEPEEEANSEWFQANAPEPQDSNSEAESETEDDDSDNDDVAGEGPSFDDEDNDGANEYPSKQDEDVEMPEQEEIKMGEDDSAMEYDQDHIFKHLCFYLDTPENAVQNGMGVHTKYEDEINQSFAKVKELLIEHGGRIVDLDEAKLTHIVIDKRDISRRVELDRRTCNPKHRRLIVSDYVQACVEENTILDEDEWKP